MTAYLPSAKSNLPAGRQGLETILFFLLLLFLPTQFGKHFWLPSSYVLGQRIDYLSPTLYLTDILILLLFISWIKGRMQAQPINSKLWKKRKNFILLFLVLTSVFIFCNSLFSLFPIQAFYGWVKLGEISFVTFYTRQFFRKQRNFFIFPFIIGIIFESILAIGQFYQQGSIGGFLYFLGERTFTSVTPGIANASIHGQLILRPYGTFSHPNVLAGYLVIGMTLLGVSSIHSVISEQAYKVVSIKNIFLIFVLIIGTVGLFLTLSRVAILLWIIVLIFLIKRALFKKLPATYYLLLAAATILVVIFMVPLLLPRFTQLNLQDESVLVREQLNYNALQMIFQHPLFGVGTHNFLLALPSFYHGSLGLFTIQPVHNIFLLIASETGLIGLWLVVSFITLFYLKLFKILRSCDLTKDGRSHLMGFSSKQINSSTLSEDRNSVILGLLLLTEVIILGSFDHYFLTIQQGELLLGIIVGVCLARLKNSSIQKQ